MFWDRKKTSKDLAKDRLKTVLFSERIDCSPQTMLMMKNDIIQVVSKYIPVNDEQVEVHYVSSVMRIEAFIPIHNNTKVE